ncbi:MAG TPA: hypothetical protein ENN32_01765 [Chloroflexi bacterium]|nr:hypothetical protein [Chloroflexota bacterium]
MMKKLFLLISLLALVIIFAAAILALLSVFNLMPLYIDLGLIPDDRQEQDQIVILVTMTDSVESKKMAVEKAWLIYYVLSRHDTMMVDQIDEQEIISMALDQPVRQRPLIRAIEKQKDIQIDYYVLLDEQAAQSISNLYDPQQNSFTNFSGEQVCGMLQLMNGDSLIKAFDLSSNHIKTDLSNGLLMEIVDNKSGILCNYMD